MSGTLVDTELAALYLLVVERGGQTVLVNEDDIAKAKRRIYNLARDGKLTRHGGTARGAARWDLKEIHVIVRPT